MRQELISVIVSVYNIAGYLPKCFETISHQTYRNLEIILVDDGSTDHSGILCDELAATDSRAKVIHQQNLGLWAARNSGKRIAKGNYFLFVDGDDYLHLGAIDVMYEAINRGSGYDMSMIDRKNTNVLDEDVFSPCENLTFSELSQEDLINNMIGHEDKTLFVFQWNKLYRRELIEDLWCREYVKTQDFDFNFRVYLNLKKAIWIHRVLYFYVQRPGSLCHNARAWELYYKCRTEMLFRNYVDLPSDRAKYKHVILSVLYPFMLHHIGERISSPEWHEVAQKCLGYERTTRKDLWKDDSFSFWQKTEWTIRVRSARNKVLFKILTKLKNFKDRFKP